MFICIGSKMPKIRITHKMFTFAIIYFPTKLNLGKINNTHFKNVNKSVLSCSVIGYCSIQNKMVHMFGFIAPKLSIRLLLCFGFTFNILYGLHKIFFRPRGRYPLDSVYHYYSKNGYLKVNF